jgi:hypothetical protein
MRRVAPLTDTLIRKSKIKETDYTLADGNGLHLLIQNNGIKKWEFVYTSPTDLSTLYHTQNIKL